ncbi:hypothetical protein [Novosphingobium sp. ST904]|uniref:hypothetical protein n=1 Tax=Novosphingobium sp. ST904 TaxID=1684385 RepID=UPI0006C8DE0E|nr:hypothetical protein [Novosphingobium sp. ST904]KPH66902.1 hypothetical protein ADT71_03890 [Novosphingobium sp. ST904]TCM39150.1 hypothetical protein EDF59_10629 [Novosphingobium sp. ST904]
MTPRNFLLIVGARLKGSGDHALSIGWHAESFARTKRLKPLAKLLTPEPTREQKRAAGSSKVRAMFRNMKRNQEKQADGTG